MRSVITICALLLATSFIVLLPAFALKSAPKAPKPKLIRITMYTWGLGTGGTVIDISKGKAECFYPGIRISATLTKKELGDLRTLVEQSRLRNFRPSDRDINERMPMLDECPPTLILTWSDKKRVFWLPLSNTVKSKLPQSRKRCYRAMDDICDRLYGLEDKYNKEPYATKLTPSSKLREKFDEERDRILGRRL